MTFEYAFVRLAVNRLFYRQPDLSNGSSAIYVHKSGRVGKTDLHSSRLEGGALLTCLSQIVGLWTTLCDPIWTWEFRNEWRVNLCP